MIVVSDSTPLITLMKATRLDLLHRLFGEIIIPDAVYRERATGLDLGESEAIVYADDTNADMLLMDELAGRRIAKDMGLTIMGSVGILVSAYKEGFLLLHQLYRELFMRRINVERQGRNRKAG